MTKKTISLEELKGVLRARVGSTMRWCVLLGLLTVMFAARPAVAQPAAFLRRHSGMTTDDSDDLLRVNCGRCGKSLMRSIEDLGDRRTIDCEECEKSLPARESTSRIQRRTPAGRRA